jgi:hypothetical protein
MSSEFWGMTAFLITSLVFATTSLILKKKLDQARQSQNRKGQKASPNQSHDYEMPNKK